MFTGQLAPVTTTGSWVEALELRSSEDGQPVDLAPYAIMVTIRHPDGGPLLSVSTADGGVIRPVLGVMQWRFASLSALQPGTYEVGVRITDGVDPVDLVIGRLPVLKGF